MPTLLNWRLWFLYIKTSIIAYFWNIAYITSLQSFLDFFKYFGLDQATNIKNANVHNRFNYDSSNFGHTSWALCPFSNLLMSNVNTLFIQLSLPSNNSRLRGQLEKLFWSVSLPAVGPNFSNVFLCSFHFIWIQQNEMI